MRMLWTRRTREFVRGPHQGAPAPPHTNGAAPVLGTVFLLTTHGAVMLTSQAGLFFVRTPVGWRVGCPEDEEHARSVADRASS